MADRRRCLHSSESFDGYCCSCQTVTCIVCHTSVSENGDHVMRDVIEVADERRCFLDDAVTTISNKLAELEDSYVRLGQWQADSEEHEEELRRHISTAADHVRSLVDEKQRSLGRHVDLFITDRRQLLTAVENQLSELATLLVRCEECKNASSLTVIREFDSLGLDLLLEDLALMRIDHESLIGTPRHCLPPCQDFLQWDATQLFAENVMLGGLVADEDRNSHLEPMTSWREAKNRLEQIITAPTDPHSGSGSSPEQFGEAHKQLDALWRIVSDLEDQLEETRLRNTALTETLSETRQLLETERHRQTQESAQDGTRPKQLERALSEVERLISEQDAESRGRQTHRVVGGVAVNLAVIGISGVGKSSFINAVRGLTADDEDRGAAAVGVIETTTEITAYTHPDHPGIKFWDLPGVGTDRFPRADYLRLITVERYDMFVIMSATRFTETDTWLVNEISRRGKKFVFVRTKVDVDVRSDRKAHPRTHSEEAVVEEILRSTKEHLSGTRHASADVFLIDSYATHRYDFRVLTEKLLCELPASKSDAMTRRQCVVS